MMFFVAVIMIEGRPVAKGDGNGLWCSKNRTIKLILTY